MYQDGDFLIVFRSWKYWFGRKGFRADVNTASDVVGHGRGAVIPRVALQCAR
jgi:hypothetical protein